MTDLLQNLKSINDENLLTGLKTSFNDDIDALPLSLTSTLSSDDDPNSTKNLIQSNSETEIKERSSTISSTYIFLDFSSNDENNLNRIEFTDASYMVVNSNDFSISEKKSFNFIDKINNGFIEEKQKTENYNEETVDGGEVQTLKYQQFVQSLTDYIHENSILAEKPLLFVVLNGWDLRLKFIKYSKDMGVQLPSYLEYPSYFDLRKEFIKYEELNQNIEFNSVNCNQVNLEFIKKKLEIIQDNVNDNLDSMLLITKKMISLDKSSQIFKKPHDMNLDLSHFFIEKSRVVYLTNLPNDATQPELEAWFSQFTGRIIAFWVLKNPMINHQSINNQNDTSNTVNNNNNENLKTCSGFAIFASHEDAIEALSMNGNLFNDRLIEIQPSSARVLDNAQDILSPFPSSKNKPRPGDWNCPSCGFSNFQRRTACFRCSFPAASAAAVQESMHSGNTSSNASSATVNSNNKSNTFTNNNITSSFYKNNNNSGNNPTNFNGVNNQYNNYNHANYSYNYNNNNNNLNNYNINKQNNDPGTLYNIGVNNTNGNSGNNGNNGNNNNGNANNNNITGNNSGYNSRQSSNVPFRAGDWKCINETCSYHNFAKNICCLKCGAPRVQSAIINGHAHNQHHNYNHNNNNTNNNNHNNGNHNNNNVNVNNNGPANNDGNNTNQHGYHHNNNNNLKNNNRNNHLMDNYSARSNSLPNHMNLQFNQNVNNNNSTFNQYQSPNQQSNYNKYKSTTNDLFNLNSVPNTPTNSRHKGYQTSNINNMTSNQILNADFDLTSGINGLSLNNSSIGINTNANDINNMFNINNLNSTSSLNNLNNLNNMNMTMNSLNSFGGINNMTLPLTMNGMTLNNMDVNHLNNINRISGLNAGLNKQISSGLGGLNVNGSNGLNGFNNFSGLNDLSRTLSSPIITGTAVGAGSSDGTFSSVRNNDDDRSNSVGGESN
jgi:hypothetical protein